MSCSESLMWVYGDLAQVGDEERNRISGLLSSRFGPDLFTSHALTLRNGASITINEDVFTNEGVFSEGVL